MKNLKYIDLHNHLAWGIDDGAQTKEETEVILKEAKKESILVIASTPHLIPGETFDKQLMNIKTRQEELRELAEEYGIILLHGCEFFLNDSYLNYLKEYPLPTLHTSTYLLCEFDVRRKLGENDEVEDRLYELIVAGYKPIIAHVERYFHKGIDLKRVQEWIDMGCFIQINRTSILGMHGNTCQKNAMKLLDAGMCHLVATDTHQAQGRRICVLEDAYEIVMKRVGKDATNILFLRNPKRIINNQELLDIEVKKQKNFLKRLFSK